MRNTLSVLSICFTLTLQAQRRECPAYDSGPYQTDKYIGFNTGIKYYGSTYVSAGFSFINEMFDRFPRCFGGYVCRGIYVEYADDVNSKTNSIHAGVWAGSFLSVGIEANSVFTNSHVNLGIQPLMGVGYRSFHLLAGYNIQPITNEVNPPNRWTFMFRAHIPVILLRPGGSRKKYDLE